MTWHEETAKRQTRNATWLAMLISGVYLIYNLQYIRPAVGRLLAIPYGYSIEILTSLLIASIGLLALNSKKKNGIVWLLLGGAMLYHLSPLAFMIALPVPITWVIARLIFKHHPNKSVWVFIIPLFACLGAWFGAPYLIEAIRQIESLSKKEVIQKSVVEPQAIVTAPGGARLRAGPSTQSAIIGTINNGEMITILGQESGWYKVKHLKAGQIRIGYLYHTLAEVKGTVPLSSAPFPAEEKEIFPATLLDNSKPSDGLAESTDKLLQESDLRLSEDNENHRSDSPPLSEYSLIGRWEGNLGEQVLILVIESFEANQWLGHSELRWKESSSSLRMEVQGRLDPATLEVTLMQKQQGAVIGTFTGKISFDGATMKGEWIFAEDPSQKYNWQVNRIPNSSNKN